MIQPFRYEIGFGVEGGAHLPQAAVTAGTFQAVFVPVFVQGLEQVAVFNLAVAAGASLLFSFGLDGEHRHTCGDRETNTDTGTPTPAQAQTHLRVCDCECAVCNALHCACRPCSCECAGKGAP